MEYFLGNEYNINTVGKENVKYISARELICRNRIDLVVKYKYVEMYVLGIECQYIIDIYKAHLAVFTAGSFVEEGSEKEKSSFGDYITSFNQLIMSISQEGIDPEISVIPIGRENTILNGAHRVAIAAYYNQEVPVVYFADEERHYDYNYFERGQLEKQYLDYILIEYVKLTKNVFCACLWPSADSQKLIETEELIKNRVDVICKRRINLSYNGIRNFMINIYGNQEWTGGIEKRYYRIDDKASACFSNKNLLTIFLLESDNLKKIKELKGDIRNIYGIGNHSIHISDNANESLAMVKLLFNDNSLNLLDKGNIVKYISYVKKIQELNKYFNENKIDSDQIIIDSSGIMGIYGIREPEDVDYLAIQSDKQFPITMNEHSSELKYHSVQKEELIYNPKFYLFCYDMKFLTLDTLIEFKKRRGEQKDKDDIILMQQYIDKPCIVSVCFLQAQYIIKRSVRNKLIRTVPVLKKLRLYPLLINLYHKLIK